MLQSHVEDDDTGVPSYIEELINKIADREGFTDYVITNSAGSNVGDGYQGDLLRFKINGKQNNVLTSLSLISKMPSPNLLRRQEFNTDKTFGREIYVYGYLLPYFIEFQKKHGISAEDGFYSFPKCYGTILDDKANGNHAIVMEDLVSKDYVLWDKLKDIDYDHTKLVMEELGKFHAVSFAIRDKNPEKINEIMANGSNTFHKLMYNTPAIAEFHNVNINKAIGALEPHETNLIEKLENIKRLNYFLEIIDEVFSHTTPEPFGVMIHGDLWNNNIMYHHEDKTPSKVSFIDWQLAQFGSPALDVVHYIFCSLDQNIRAKYYTEFVDLYYNSLVKTLRKFGCDDQKLFKLTDLRNQIKEYGRISIIVGPLLSQIMTSRPENSPNMDILVQQMQDARENGEVNANVMDIFVEGSTFKDRVSNLIRDAAREGFL